MPSEPATQLHQDDGIRAARLADARDKAWREVERLREELRIAEAEHDNLAQQAYEAQRKVER